MGDLLGIIGVIILIWFIWLFTGGPARYEKENPGPYIKAPAPLDTGETYGPKDLLR